MTELREKIAREIATDVRRGAELWPHYAELADRILNIPEIAEALKAKQREETVYRTGKLGHSIGTRS